MNVTIREGETVQVEFVSRPVHLQGRVTRGGVPVPGLALVFVSLDAGGGQFGPFAPLTPEVELELMRDVTSEDGYYELLLDQPGRYFVSTESEHDSSFDTSRLVEVPDADVHIFDVDLGGTAVVGKVIDEQTGEPVSRAFIHARPTEGDLMTRSSYAVNRSDGRFELVLNPGRYILGIRADGYLSQELELDVDGAGPVEVTIGMKLDRLIRGRVVDEMGRGTANVFVSACTENASMEARGAGRTKADGSFEIGGLTGLSYNVLAVMEGRGFAFASNVMPGSPEVTLILQPGGWVAFVVRDMYGNPIEDAFVALSAISGSPVLDFAGGRTDAAGRVVVLLPLGHVEITIRKNEVESKIALDVPRGGTIPVEAVLR